MKKSSKKKFVPLIVVSGVALVLGGLIYLGISAFPDLLLSEEELLAQEANGVAAVGNRLVIEQVDESNSVNDGATANAAANVNLDDGVQFVYVASSASKDAITINEASNKRVKENFVLDLKSSSHEEFVPQSSIESISNEHVSYTSHYERDFESASKDVVKTKKAKVNKNQTTRSNEAVVETSLLVIGAVDLLSMILIKRKKHIFR